MSAGEDPPEGRAAEGAPGPRPAVDDGARRALMRGEHANPHEVLGVHDGVLRAWRPDAVAVVAHLADGEDVELAQVDADGLFEVQAPSASAGYRLTARFGDGRAVTFDDPYRAWPTLGPVDLHLFGEGRHRRLWEAMGAHHRTHDGSVGTAFAVWAPRARAVRVVGDWNRWDGRVHPMRQLDGGVWELFVPGVDPGARYKFEVLGADGDVVLKADPMAFAAEPAPGTASIVTGRSTYQWGDATWLAERATVEAHRAPMSVYEVHLGSWRRRVDDDGSRPLTYQELAVELPVYVRDMGFTHIELMPPAEHPYGGSWGYQVTGYYAPSSQYGSPDDFRALVDGLHAAGLGVIVDWVPAHFPRDEWALARFDGRPLYEHADPRRGAQPDWGTLVFDLGRNEVRNFLTANALFWLEELHVDGLRVDAVASMLYLDYSRAPGEWLPNQFGGRENLEAVAFLQETNELVYGQVAGAVTIAEESTAWPQVSGPTSTGGLGFGFKWNMGWMHDTLSYFRTDPAHRPDHHGNLTFGLLYAFAENFVLPLSHDEVVHGKASLVGKMPGEGWQRLANLRALFAWMWAHPGKQVLFMGGEIAQEREWSEMRALDWDLLDDPGHAGVQELVRRLNAVYRAEPALWEADADSRGFEWIDASAREQCVLSFLRRSADGTRVLACVANLRPVPREAYRVGLPLSGRWREVVNTDAGEYGGSGWGNLGGVTAADIGWQGQAASAEVTLPPLAVVWLVPD